MRESIQYPMIDALYRILYVARLYFNVLMSNYLRGVSVKWVYNRKLRNCGELQEGCSDGELFS